MEERMIEAREKLNSYVDSITGLSDEQKDNFEIKRNHSFRVADIAKSLAESLSAFQDNDIYLVYLLGLYHDIGRFKQLKEFGTFNDEKSLDHAACSVEVINELGLLGDLDEEQTAVLLTAIQYHNKHSLPKELSDYELLFAKLIRDADKLDIYKVITDYYSNPKATPNHTLTWEMPKSNVVSKNVAKSVLRGVLVLKEDVKNELDIKVMQLSWVYDMNFKYSFNIALKNRYFEKIYNSMPKNDAVIDIYRKIKVFVENKVTEQ